MKTRLGTLVIGMNISLQKRGRKIINMFISRCIVINSSNFDDKLTQTF